MREAPDSLMIFAAGFGTRMGSLTANRPKPLIPVAGKALIDHAMTVADEAGITRKVINLHYLPDQITAHLAHRSDILYSPEPGLILETGGGLKAALPLLGPGPVMILNSDAVWTGANPLAQLRAAWDGERMDGLVLLLPLPMATGHTGTGDFVMDTQGRITWGKGEQSLIYLGAQILRTEGLADIPDRSFSLYPLWNRMMAAGRLYGLVHQGGWCDVGRPEGIALAESVLGVRT